MNNRFVSTPITKTRSEDPFANRKNFPVFEDAIRTENTIDENALDDYSDAMDDSIYSYASTDMLNVSIGVRAALDEHLRHVAKFGIDDSHYLERRSEQDQSIESSPGDPREVLWERLVDPNYSHTCMNNSSHILSRDMRRLMNKVSILQPVDRSQDIEVVNDYTSDYFNSSRVHLLKTPERNHSIQVQAVTSRNNRDNADEFFAALESPIGQFQNTAHLHPFVESEATENDMSPSSGVSGIGQSFSLSAVDLSRISADGSEDLASRQSPDVPFALRAQQTKNGETRNVFPFATERHEPLERSHNSPPFRSTRQTPALSPRKYIPPSGPNNFSFGINNKESSVFTPRSNRRKEYAPDFAEHLTLSPIGAQSTSHSCRQTTPSSEPLRYVTRHYHNPLSPPALPPRDDHISSMIVEYSSTPRGAPGSDVSTLHDTSSENTNKSKVSSTDPDFGNESPTSSSSSILLGNRRRFRTVVPTQVFLNDFDDFP